MIIGITGKKGCGKDTAAEYLEKAFGFTMLDFTRDVLAPILANQGRKVTRENLIKLAMDGRKKHDNGVWARKVSELVRMKPQGNFVIAGVRFVEEVEVFKKAFREGFRLISIECDARLRWERVKKRGTKGEENTTFEEFMETEREAETERAIIPTMGLSDFTVDNNGTIEELQGKIKDIFKNLKI